MLTSYRSRYLTGALALCVPFVISCGDPASGETPTPMTQRANLKVLLETLPHSHVFKDVTATFAVRNLDRCTTPGDEKTCEGVAGLPITAFVLAKDYSQEQTPQVGKLEDKGGGLYSWYRSFPVFGGNVIGLRFERDGHAYTGMFPFDTTRGGGERYFCDANRDSTMDHAYQIRWSTSTGPVKADGKPVTFTVELLRSYNAPPLNMAEPWRNNFESLRPTELMGQAPTVKLMAGTGLTATEVMPLVPTYTGRGLYTVTRAFTAQDLGGQNERTFWLRIGLTDDKGCLVEGSDETEFYFAVSK